MGLTCYFFFLSLISEMMRLRTVSVVVRASSISCRSLMFCSLSGMFSSSKVATTSRMRSLAEMG